MKSAYVTSCGHLAYAELLIPQKGRAIGNTSKGVFLKTDANRVIFLSREAYRNPYTLNLHPFPDILGQVELGEEVSMGNGSLDISSCRLHILISPEQVFWRVEKPPFRISRVSLRENTLAIHHNILASRKPEGYFTQLQNFFDNSGKISLQEESIPPFRNLNSAIISKNLENMLGLASGFLGTGRGLTPSGDDLLCGILLSMNRWNPHRWGKRNLEKLNLALTELAYKKTTTLSANLIEASAHGESDERLIGALDSIVTGDPSPDEGANLLLSYGNSSGMDAFTGMVIATL